MIKAVRGKFFLIGILESTWKVLEFCFLKAVWTLSPYHTHTYTPTRSSWRCTYSIFTYMYLTVSLTEWLTLSQAFTISHRTIAPLWYHYTSAEALGAAWLSFYQILGPFKWMIAVLLPWPTDKKLSLFVQLSPLLSLFLPYPSLKAQLHSFVTLKEKKFFPRIPCRATSYSLFFFLGPPKGTGSLVVSSHQHCTAAVSFLCVLG